MAVTNKVIAHFDIGKIASAYDFFKITTSEKYIPKGAYLLDKPQMSMKAKSVVFDYGKSAFIMFDKGEVGKGDLMEQIGDERISISSLHPSEIKDYVLLRLFLYSLGNYSSSENQFNNLTGKLFVNQPEFAAKNGKSIMALSIDVDAEMCLTIEATTFTSMDVFKRNKKVLGPDYPKYVLLPSGRLRRSIHGDTDEKLFIRKGLPGRKAEYPFMSLRPEDVCDTKAFYAYSTLNALKRRYGELLDVSFGEIALTKTIGTKLDEDFVDRALITLKTIPVVAVDLVRESLYSEDFDDMAAELSNRIGIPVLVSKAIQKGAANIVFIHSKDYYDGKDDPYSELPRNEVIQCVTAEDSLNKIIKDSSAVINTIIKELAIKIDLSNSFISMDKWPQFGFKDVCYFGTEVDKARYFMKVFPDGSFEFHDQLPFGGFNDVVISSLNDEMDGIDAKGKTIVADDRDNILLISRTSMYCLPKKEVFSMNPISRSKESRELYLEGVVDINLFKQNGNTFYSAGMVGRGMNTGIPRASLLYKVSTIRGTCILDKLLSTMSVMFVKYNAFTVLPYPVKYLREYIATKKPF